MKHGTKKALLIATFVCASLVLALSGCASDKKEEYSGPSDALENAYQSALTKAKAVKAKAEHEAELMEPFYALFMGCDTRANTRDGEEKAVGDYWLERSDTIMVVYVVPESGQVTLISVPRDTEAYIDGNKVRINEFMNQKGPEGAMEGIGSMAGVDIKYYFATDFARFAQLIDGFGGVDVNVPFTMSLRDILRGGKVTLEGGDNHLDGPSALVFSRIRKVYGDYQDACRQVQDRQVVQRVLEAASSSSADNVPAYLAAISSSVDTNLPAEDLEFYANLFCEQEGSLNVKAGTFPFEGGVDDEGNWYAYYDEATWKQVIDEVEKGGDPTNVVGLPNIYPM